ncbi:MAG: hypothetical protein KF729_09510 [Sandaracinaceae bacterium]|nr:hypothetical protein [Sandaracinaceae bacterium]
MRTMIRLRRALLAVLFATATALASGHASADMAPSPVGLRVSGQAAEVTGGEPDRATFELANLSREAIEVFLYRVVLREGTSHPLEIGRVEVDGREAPRTITVPAGATTRVTVFFTLPSTLHGRSRWQLELRVTASGWGSTETHPATLSRARRTGKLPLGSPRPGAATAAL